MRAYSGLRRTQLSGFSDVACAQTASSASSQTGGPRSRKILLPGDLHPTPTNDNELRPRAANEATNPVAVSPEPQTVAVPLTSAECTTLGGKVVPMFLCKSFGNAACITTDQAGTAHAVCISKAAEVSGAPSEDAPIVSPNNRADLLAPDSNVVVAPLTSQECKGLGGTEISTNKCGALDQKTCATVDKHGVIRVACIDEVAN